MSKNDIILKFENNIAYGRGNVNSRRLDMQKNSAQIDLHAVWLL